MPNINLKNIHEWPLYLQLVAFFLIFIVILYLGYRWDIMGLEAQLTKDQFNEQDIKQQLESTVSKEAKQQSDTAQFQQLAGWLASWQQKLISYQEMPALLSEILKIGGTDHLYFTLFSPDKEVKMPYYVKAPIRIVVVGNYNQLADFISQLANLPKLVVIDNFLLTNQTSTNLLGEKLAELASSENLLTMDLMISVYYLPEGAKHA